MVKILDFGLARLEHGGLTNHDATTAGRLVGTLDYLAPEQAAGQQPIDARADLYGLGATLFKLLSGRPPHGSSHDRPILEHLQRLTTTDADSLAEIRQDLNPEFCRVVASLLARDPNDRPASADQVVQLIRPFTDSADLKDLAEHAMVKIDRELEQQQDSGETVGLAPSSPLAVDQPKPTGAKPTGASTQPASHRGGYGWFLLATVTTLLIGLIGGFAALTLWIQTGDAVLKIESTVNDFSLQLIADGRVAKEIEVHPGDESTRIRAGKYELRVAGKTDNVRVDQRTLLVMRGDQRIVKITRDAVPPQAAVPIAKPASTTGRWTRQLMALEIELNQLRSTLGPNHPKVLQVKNELAAITAYLENNANKSSDLPTSRGRTYDEWTKIVLRETDAATIADGIAAMVELSTPAEHAETFATLLAIARRNESRLSTPVCDAYIHYLTLREERDHDWREMYPVPPESWSKVVMAPWLAIPIARGNPRNETAFTAVSRVLGEISQAREYEFAFRVPKGYAKDLYQLAEEGTEMRHRGLALRLAQLGGFDDSKIQKLALSILTGDGDETVDVAEAGELRWCLQCLANAAQLEITKRQSSMLNADVMNANYRYPPIDPETMPKCFIAAMTINRRLGIDSGGDVLKAALGIRSATGRLNWPRTSPNRFTNQEDSMWSRIASPVPKAVVKQAFETIIAMPSKDQAVLDRLNEMKRINRGFYSGSPETEAVKLLDEAIMATQQVMN